MAVMKSPSASQHKQLLQQITSDYPGISFVLSKKTWWDPETQTVYYKKITTVEAFWSLFHELGHMSAKHSTYRDDLELIKLEAEAWDYAKAISNTYETEIDQDYIEDCVDSYRDWLHKRSRCPGCKQTGIQKSSSVYMCLNCRREWSVTQSRFCRSYRKTKTTT